MRGVTCLGLLAPVVVVSFASAATIKLNQPEYWADPGSNFVTEVIIQIDSVDGEIGAANVGFKLESSIGTRTAVGSLTTSMADIVMSSQMPYIFTPNSNFFDTGSGGAIATGGDNTDDSYNDVLMPGDYYLAEITWTVSEDAVGDFDLSFIEQGTTTVLTPDWTMEEINYLDGYLGAVVHVPEPTVLVFLGLGAALVVLRRRE